MIPAFGAALAGVGHGDSAGADHGALAGADRGALVLALQSVLGLALVIRSLVGSRSLFKQIGLNR